MLLAAAALALIAVGIASKQLTAVWSKAVKLCLECVGIG
ncbi:MAG: thioredoxin [Clostridia bacterium]|nr:thioredoxin [Clostridia bacterium]MBQ3867044.1 thioredoxin [Clostridia bacterium]MBR0159305.1 thioredoxin [Clostridia bacterium]MBR7061934.1 thioredoxin [Clostridia bacterium]